MISFHSRSFFHQFSFQAEFLQDMRLLQVVTFVTLEDVLGNVYVLFSVRESFVMIQQILLVLNSVFNQIISGPQFSQLNLLLLYIGQIFMNIRLMFGRITTPPSTTPTTIFLNYQITPILTQSMRITIIEFSLLIVDHLGELILGDINSIHGKIWKNKKMGKQITDINLNCSHKQCLSAYYNSYYKNMSEDKMDQQEDLKGASRRSRKDEQGRDYVCGCGKRYLSYPALYTHIKTKHDGQQPEGTQKTGVAPVNRRVKQKTDDRVLKEVQAMVHLENLGILAMLDENARGTVPIHSRVRKDAFCKELTDAYSSLIKTSTTVHLDKKSSLQTVLICFLIGAGQYTSEAMFQHYCNFVRYYRNCFIEYAQEVYDLCFKTQDRRKDKIVNLLQCRMGPIVCDFFLRFYLPYEKNEKKNTDFMAVMQYICLDFCQWMYSNGLTIVQVSLNKPNYILRKNLIQPKNRDKKDNEQKQADEQKDDKDQSHESSGGIDQEEQAKQIKAKENELEQANQIASGNSSPVPES